MKVYDTDGKLQVSGGGSVDKLDDVGDVNAPAPSDGYFVYWDNTAGKWQSKALAEGDIPAAIARDAEVAGGIATHAALESAHHAKDHASRHQSGGADNIKLDDLAAPDDNTDLNASITKHGLLKKLDNVATNYLNGQGAWTAPSGGGGGGTTIQDADGDTKIQVEESADEDKIRMDVHGVEAFLMHDDGILTLAKQSAALGYRATSDQTITKNTWTKVQLNAESYDIQGEFDPTTNYRFTAKKAGLYLVIGKIYYGSFEGGKTAYIKVKKSGADLLMNILQAYIGSYVHWQVSGVASLAANDYLELFTYHNCTVNKDLCIGEASTFLSVCKLA